MASKWYYQIMGQVMGPVDARSLKEKAETGDLSRETLVRKGEAGEWVLADRIADLFPPLPPIRFTEEDDFELEPVPPAPPAPAAAAIANAPVQQAAKSHSAQQTVASAEAASESPDETVDYAFCDRTFKGILPSRQVRTIMLVSLLATLLVPVLVSLTYLLLPPLLAIVLALAMTSAWGALIYFVIWRIGIDCVLLLAKVSSQLAEIQTTLKANAATSTPSTPDKSQSPII